MRLFLAVLFALSPLACMDQATPTGPSVVRPDLAIADAAHGFTPGFYWLPPLGQQPARADTFDAALAPEVEICELAASACRRVLATYTIAFGPGGETVRLDGGARHYAVNWDTRDFDLSADARYRIIVRAGRGVQLGYADVVAVANGSNRRNVDASDAVAVVIGADGPDQVSDRNGNRWRGHRPPTAGVTRAERDPAVRGDAPRPAWNSDERRRHVDELEH